MSHESQKKKDESVLHQALLQSPRKFKSFSDSQFSFASVAPALPPKTSSKMKLKPVTVNFEGGSRVALSHKPQSVTSSQSPYRNQIILASTTAQYQTTAALNSISPVTSPKIGYFSSPPSESSFSSFPAANLIHRTTFMQKNFKSNGNNNNSGTPIEYYDTEDNNVQIPNGLVSSRVARFSQKVRSSARTSADMNYAVNNAASVALFGTASAKTAGNYEILNSTGPYDNVDLNMKYCSPSTNMDALPPLPPKSYKSVKSPRTGARVIPVSEGVTSPPPMFPRVPEKQSKATERGRNRTAKMTQDTPVLSRSLSAPSSPLLNRKFASGRSPTGHNVQKFKRNRSTSSSKGRSPSPTRSEILPRAQRSISVTSFGSDDVGMQKAPSIRSLRDRFGSETSIGSYDTEQLEEDLKLIHEESVKQRRRDQFIASREKKRLEKILTMCEKVVKQSKDKDKFSRQNEDLNKLLVEISVFGNLGKEMSSQILSTSSPSECEANEPLSGLSSCQPAVNASNSNNQSSDSQSRNFRRLASLERDIFCQNLPAERQGPALPAKLRRSKNKSPPVSPKGIIGRSGDVAEIQQLYEQGLQKMENLKQRISELEIQLDECVSALEMEKALVAGELESEQEKLTEEEQICDNLKEKIIDVEENYMKQREIQNSLLENEKKKLSELQEKLKDSQRQLNNCPESIRDIWEVELKKDQTILEQDLKNFEDIEFQTLENISRMDEDKEMKQKKLMEDQRKCNESIKRRKGRVDVLQKQMDELMMQEKENYQRLHSMRDHAIKELQEHREETSFLQRKYYELTGEKPPAPDLEVSIRTKSQSTVFKEDMPRLTRATSTETSPLPRLSTSSQHSFQLPSPIENRPTATVSNDQGAAAASEVMSKSTHCVKPYLQKLQDPRSSDQNPDPPRWRGFDVMSMSSVDSLDTTTSAAWSNRTPDEKEMEQIKLIENQLIQAKAERQRLLAEMNAYVNKSNQEMDSLGSDPALQSASSSTVAADTPSTSGFLSQSLASPEPPSSPTEDGGTADAVRRREHNDPKKQTRPMTRYLPVRAKNFDLKEHIESCGHHPDACRHISVTSTTCRGYLMKMGGRIRTWKKRWFVLDRQKKIISYFHNKHESKLRGMIYFQAIEDVFFDHLKMHRSPNPALTFCVKCYDRTYSLVAPSAEALRIWMDVVVTSAEGYTEYMKTFE